MPPSNHIAYTAAINPSGSDALTLSQIWAGLQRKIGAGQEFVGGAILTTDVLKKYTTSTGLPVTDREVEFAEGNRRVKETCIEYAPMKVEFHQPDGSKVMNIISQGPGGEEDLYMTYAFEWLHPEAEGDEAKLEELRKKEQKMAQNAVESTIKVMREMVKDGRIKA